MSLDNDDFQIVVSNNCSTDNTLQELKKIHDKRLKIVEPSKGSVAAVQNILSVYNHANGKYLLILLDKDILNTNFLPTILNKLKTLDFCCGYFTLPSAKKKYSFNVKTITNKVDKFIKIGYLFKHPTGYVMSRKEWQKVKNKFENIDLSVMGAFIQNYIFPIIIDNTSTPCVIIDYPLCAMSPAGSKNNLNSSFTYTAKNKNLYFEPSEVFKQAQVCFLQIQHLHLSQQEHKRVLKALLYHLLKRATLEYAYMAQNKNIAEHYYIDVQTISACQMWDIERQFLKIAMTASCYANFFEKYYLLSCLWIKSLCIWIHYMHKKKKSSAKS